MVQLAKERLSGPQHVSLDKKEYQLGDRMDDITRKQKDREIQSIYPENTLESDLPNELAYIGAKDKKQRSQQLDETPLMNVSQATVNIDHSRMVDPEHGTGALYDFVPASTIKGMEDWIPESEHYKYYQTTNDFPIEFELENEFTFPENLSLYTYEIGNCSEFRRPNKCLTGN